MANSKSGKNDSETKSTLSQMVVLKRMSEGINIAAEARQYQLHELAQLTGNDEREVLRSLYILEGHKYVAPYPAGDFTSKIWHITEGGLDVVKNMAEAPRVF